MTVLNQTAFLFPDKILRKFRLHEEIYIKDPLIMEDILFFEQVDRKRPWESFRLMNLKGDLLMLFQLKYWCFRPRFRIYANKSSDNFAKNSENIASLYENLSFLGELKGRIWTLKPNYWFEDPDGIRQFDLVGNLWRTRFLFKNFMLNGPKLMAEADKKFFNVPDHWGLRIYPGVDYQTRAIILCAIIAVIRQIRTTFYPAF